MILLIGIGAAAIVMTAFSIGPGQATPKPREYAVIDVASSAPILVRGGSAVVPLEFSVACGRPISNAPCNASTRLFTRSEGNDWSAVPGERGGADVRFPIVAPPSGYLDYYLEVDDQATGTTATFPVDGAAHPLRVYVLPFVQPHRLKAIPFDQARQPDSVINLPWGSEPGEAGLVEGNEGSTVGPQALDVDASGNVYLLDQANKRVEVFDKAGQPINSIPLEVGPSGDMVLGDDGTVYVLDGIPSGPGSDPVIHEVIPAADALGPLEEVTSFPAPESGTTLLREEDGVLWEYGVPSDAWRPVVGGTDALPQVQMGMPSAAGEVLRRVHDLRQIDIAPLAGDGQPGLTLVAPGGWFFGELALVEPDGSGGYWVVARTWREHPQPLEHHDVIHVSGTGDILDHFAVDNSEYAETASLSEFRLGADGRLYQIWTEPSGLQIRGFDLTH